MDLRVATIFEVQGPRRTALLKALGEYPNIREIRSVESWLQLVAFRPHLVLSEESGAAAWRAALYRTVARRSRLLIDAVEPKARWGLRERAIFSRADGVLADGDMVSKALENCGLPLGRVMSLPTPVEVDAFLKCAATRTGDAVHRLVYVGELAPEHGAADLLIAITDWAERNPGRGLEIWWIGEGDLTGMLRAQPLPDNLAQRFFSRLTPLELAAALGRCGLLVVPSLGEDESCPIVEALAAGLPVIGSRRDARVRRLIREGLNGWVFDPLRPGELLETLGRALDSSPAQLNDMRQNARSFDRSAFRPFADRLRQVMNAALPASRAPVGDTNAPWPQVRTAR